MRLGIWIVVLAGCETLFPLVPPDDASKVGDANVVFVTGSTHSGGLGGVAGADAICNQLAMAHGLGDGFVAWLSAPAAGAIARLDGSRGWVRTDGVPVADTAQQLGLGGPWVPIVITEDGVSDVRISSGDVWTGTGANGELSEPSCTGWTDETSGITGRRGQPDLGLSQFTSISSDSPCSTPQRLYCFGTGKVAELRLPPVTDKRWFTTQGKWTPGGGLAAADGVCQGEASAAFLTGTFQALLSTTTASGGSRFDATATYVRPDGVAIGTLSGTPDTFPVIGADGTPVTDGDLLVWTGGPPDSPSTSSSTSCNNWAGASSGTTGGWRAASKLTYELGQMTPCSAGHHLYCLEL